MGVLVVSAVAALLSALATACKVALVSAPPQPARAALRAMAIMVR